VILSDDATRDLLPGVAAGPLGFLLAAVLITVPLVAVTTIVLVITAIGMHLRGRTPR
jgi:hypothetical protein